MIHVEIEPSAQKDLDKFDQKIISDIIDKLSKLGDHPQPFQWLKKLEGYENLYRLHVGRDWVVVGNWREIAFVFVGSIIAAKSISDCGDNSLLIRKT
jgi:mRNA-degrading endonuclease RelE of RelBE toxin-antitoxin system